MWTYLKADDDVDLAHFVLTFITIFGRVTLTRELRVECIRHDEANDDQHISQEHYFCMLHPISRCSADQVVTPLIDEPMQNTKAKEDGEAEHLVDVESVAQYYREEKELQYLLLTLLEHVFLLYDANITKENPNKQIGELHEQYNDRIEEDK